MYLNNLTEDDLQVILASLKNDYSQLKVCLEKPRETISRMRAIRIIENELKIK